MSEVLQWKRPTTVKYPNVWATFKERDLNSDKLVEYRIQDVPESMFEAAIEHMVKYFIADEPASRSRGKRIELLFKTSITIS